MRRKLIALLAVFFWSGVVTAQEKGSNASPHVLVYKTKQRYRNFVAVQLSDDKKSVVAYPDPADIKAGTTMVPALLHGGYMLDKRGISLNSAFIKLSFDEYRKLKKAPAPEALYKMILDKDPIAELCDCGVKGESNSVKKLNALIDRKELRKKCAVLK